MTKTSGEHAGATREVFSSPSALPLEDGGAVTVFLDLDQRRVLRWLWWTVAALVFCGVLGQVLLFTTHKFFLRDAFIQLTDLDGESNVPAAFSGLILLIAALLLAWVAAAKSRVADAWTWAWRGLTGVFFYLTLDELAMLHEKLNYLLRGVLPAGGIFRSGWVVPYALFGVVFLLVFWRFLGQLPASARRGFVVAGAVYVLGAFGTELIESEVATFYAGTFVAELTVFVQEAMEMAGVVLFIAAILDYVRLHLPGLQLRLRAGQ